MKYNYVYTAWINFVDNMLNEEVLLNDSIYIKNRHNCLSAIRDWAIGYLFA